MGKRDESDVCQLEVSPWRTNGTLTEKWVTEILITQRVPVSVQENYKHKGHVSYHLWVVYKQRMDSSLRKQKTEDSPFIRYLLLLTKIFFLQKGDSHSSPQTFSLENDWSQYFSRHDWTRVSSPSLNGLKLPRSGILEPEMYSTGVLGVTLRVPKWKSYVIQVRRSFTLVHHNECSEVSRTFRPNLRPNIDRPGTIRSSSTLCSSGTSDPGEECAIVVGVVDTHFCEGSCKTSY